MAATKTFTRSVLGRTGRELHRLGVASSYGINGKDVEAAVEEFGVDYLYWGSLRRKSFGKAIKNLCARGLRDQLFVVVQSYSRMGSLVRPSLRRALRGLCIEHADLYLLGWWNKPVPPRILDAARECQAQGLVTHLGLSTHNRPSVPGRAAPGSPYDVVHFRYNAANRGAEQDIFPHLPEGEDAAQARAGLVSFTATRWGQLLHRPKSAPDDMQALTAGDCYRFVLSQPKVSVCMSGPKNGAQLRESLLSVERGPLEPDELARVRRFGDLVYSRGAGLHSMLED